ncbi:beta-galactosidase 10 [Andrographis paniculata]|uniref:beta-galactosidase 10 n=1 Tax=Andrographis paniculata TaxID=175694 RepID=UPI0021E94EE5|nr:beta-galactosidase 10 [Andrographis paniculata]
MPSSSSLLAVPLATLLLLSLSPAFSSAYNVSYDTRSLLFDGHRKLLISAAIHYPRSVPAMWPGLVQLAKDGGVDVIETYVFWNGHELSPDNYYFGGRYDLVKFCKIVQQAGMYLMLRIGPFVAAEWKYGGVPVWLHYLPGAVFRTDNEPFKYYMKKFTTYIVDMMKKEKLFASQGGPIILAQVENEYGFYESAYGEGGKRYTLWAANMAVSQNIGVPWIMCQQFDPPASVIDTCNSFYCDHFKPISPNKPKIWTENWPGWFKTFGSSNPHRPPEDVAFSVARFFQKGGCLQNYYMYHGGTNFGRTSGGPLITTSYDYDAPIDEYGLARWPKWGHLKELHKSIKLCEQALLSGAPTVLSLGDSQEVDVYEDSSGACAAFISNMDDKNDKTVVFRNTSYFLPAWSVSILPDCKNVVFNTAKVSSQSSVVDMIPTKFQSSSTSINKSSGHLQWDIFKEKVGIWDAADFTKIGLVDHINTTKDSTDYLWYTTSLFVDETEEFLRNGTSPMLVIESKGHAILIFVNQKLQGNGFGNGTVWTFKFKGHITLKPGNNEIALLSMTVGLQNAGAFYEWIGAGPTSVRVLGLKSGTVDLSNSTWNYKIGLEGEHHNIYETENSNSINWVSTSEPPKYQPLTWYRAVIDSPPGQDPVGLDMMHMGKGLAWLNGNEIGRYWPRKASEHEICVEQCDYRGKFMPNKCNTGCGEPTQRWYHVPRSWFKPSNNILVIFEEKGGDPTKIQLARRKVSSVCVHMSEDHPAASDSVYLKKGIVGDYKKKSIARLKCPKSSYISEVKFASFGDPVGTCGSYSRGECHDPNSISVVEKVCLKQNECILDLAGATFNRSSSLCGIGGLVRKLAVEVVCS